MGFTARIRPRWAGESEARRVGRFLRKRRVECGRLGEPALPGVLGDADQVDSFPTGRWAARMGREGG
jgi:hypothetical protein